jgi:ABC-2 type transport system ATP-binding protein
MSRIAAGCLIIMLEVIHYSKRYGQTVACNDISFCLPDGSVTVLLGPNGAGKSTLMKGITGFLRFEGRVLINGQLNSLPLSRRMLGYIPEIPSFYPNLTVSEHMEFVARAYRMKNYRDRAEELMARFSLTGHKKKLGSELSKGMAQKLNICLGLFTNPSVLLLDEPFIGLDPHAIKELKNVMEQLREEGATLLVSTHIIDSVDMLWDRTIILQSGEMKENMTREELSQSGRNLEELFFSVTEGKMDGGGSPYA